MKVYTGISDGMGGKILVAQDGAQPRPLNPRFDLYNHSPTGFSWGYGGSGPAQTALAILADHLGDGILAVHLHQRFKWEVVAHWNQRNNFVLTSDDIDVWLGDVVGTDQ